MKLSKPLLFGKYLVSVYLVIIMKKTDYYTVCVGGGGSCPPLQGLVVTALQVLLVPNSMQCNLLKASFAIHKGKA